MTVPLFAEVVTNSSVIQQDAEPQTDRGIFQFNKYE